VAVRGKNYDWGLGEFAFGMYCTAANLGLLLANNFVLAILGDAYSNQVRASDSSVILKKYPKNEVQDLWDIFQMKRVAWN
jgi:hypothetical protein